MRQDHRWQALRLAPGRQGQHALHGKAVRRLVRHHAHGANIGGGNGIGCGKNIRLAGVDIHRPPRAGVAGAFGGNQQAIKAVVIVHQAHAQAGKGAGCRLVDLVLMRVEEMIGAGAFVALITN